MTEAEKTEIKIKFIESTFSIRLFDWQKDFIFYDVPYDRAIRFARCAEKTFARCLKICFSDGEPLHIRIGRSYCAAEIIEMIGEDISSPQRLDLFIRELKETYEKLMQEGTPWFGKFILQRKKGAQKTMTSEETAIARDFELAVFEKSEAVRQ